MRQHRLPLLVLIILLTGCTAVAKGTANTPSPTATAYPRARVESPGYGFEAYLWWKPEVATRDLGLIRDAGFGWVKQTFAWRDIELEQGKYDWSHADETVLLVQHFNLKMLVRLDGDPWWDRTYTDNGSIAGGPPKNYANFYNFCGVTAARYKGKVSGYQVWNEPNLSREWGGRAPDPAQYVTLLSGCYKAIKAADPAALVISAGLAPTGNGLPDAIPDTQYLEQMYQAGAAPYFDLLGVHAPGFKAAPETSPDVVAATPALGGERFFAFRHVEDMRAIMEQHGDAGKQVAILEFGWTTDPIHKDYAWFAVDEQTKAQYMVHAFEWAKAHWQPWIGPMIALSLPEFDWTPQNEQYWWSVIDPVYPNTQTRPAYDALKQMPK
ncbi:MAG TPA: hypothetical protein VGK81_07580 [Anaerolineae bacterium]